MRYIGIDPGVGGGIACISGDGLVMSAVKMPATEVDIFQHIAFLLDVTGRMQAALEYVRASPQMGVTSAFSFGRGYGALRMALVANKIPFDEVTPQKWQLAMQCRTKGDKNVSKRRAQTLWPDLKITHAIADALLIAEYARRLEARG